jgi:hypothetical protein
MTNLQLKLRPRMPRLLAIGALTFLVVLNSVVTGLQLRAFNSSRAQSCCKGNCSRCSSVSCCAQPDQSSRPHCSSHLNWQQDLSLHSVRSEGLVTRLESELNRPLAAFQAAPPDPSLPIFQRNCSLLL